jgi:hypothetical protein
MYSYAKELWDKTCWEQDYQSALSSFEAPGSPWQEGKKLILSF